MKTFNCYYINLKKEEQRNFLIKKELEKLFDNTIINRIEGQISKVKGHGCSLSHIQCIQEFLKTDNEYTIIFEDDFQLELTPDNCLKAIEQAMKENANLFLLGYHSILINLELDKRNGYVCPFSNGQMACGYMVSREYAPILLDNFTNSCNMLGMTKNYEHYALDEYWKHIQKDNGVYACVPRMGKQRPCYSSIENKIVDYKGFCYGIIISDEINPADINLPFQYRIVKKDTNIKEEIEQVIYLYNNIDYIFFSYDYSNNKLNDIINYFKLFSIHNLPFISFENSFYISKEYLNILYSQNFNFQNLHSIKDLNILL